MFALRFLPLELVRRIERWDELKRWERKEIGQTLRKMGLSYREISAVIPVHKGTLSTWCRDLGIPNAERARLGAARERRREVGAILRQRAVDRAADIRSQAKVEAALLLEDPFWTAGVTAYWAEGTKRHKSLRFSNSDPGMIRLFVGWVERYLDVRREELTVHLHLHGGQDDSERRAFWSKATGIPLANFRKTYFKSEGTGHRKNVLYNGTATIRVRRSGALLQRVLGWSDALADRYA